MTASKKPQQGASRDSELGDGARLFISASGFTLGRGTGRLTGLITQVVLARFLAPLEFGLLALGIGLFRLVEAVGPLGLQAAVIRFGARPSQSAPGQARATVLRGVRLATISGLVLAVALFVAAPMLARDVFHKPGLVDIFRIVSLGFPLLAALVVAASATRMLRTARYTVVSRELGQPVLFLLLVLVSLSFGFRARGAAAAMVVATGVALALAITILLRVFPRSEGRAVVATPVKTMLTFSLPASLSGSSRFLVSWTDRFVVGALLPAATLGVYHAAAQLAAILPMLTLGFGAMIAPMIAELAHSNEPKKIGRLFALSTKWAVALSVPPAAVLLLAPRDALQVTFGTSYDQAAPVLVLLTLGQLIAVCGGSLGVLLVMSGKERSWAALAGGAFVLNLLLSLVLVRRVGPNGAAAATAMALSFLTAAGTWVARRMLGVWPFDWRVGKVLGLACLTLVGAWFLAPALPHSSVARAVSLFLISGTVLLLGLILTGLEEEERELLAWVRRRIFR